MKTIASLAAVALAATILVTACESTPVEPGPGPRVEPGPGADFQPGPSSDFQPGPGPDFHPGPDSADSEKIHGSGTLATVDIDLGSFDSIDLSGEGTVVVHVGAEPSLAITTDDNLHDYLDVAVVSGTLRLATVGGGTYDIEPTDSITWTVTTPALNEVTISGAGIIEASDLEADRFAARVGGAGAIDLENLNTEHLTVTVDGVGDIVASGTCRSFELTLNGVGSIDTTAVTANSGVVSIDNAGSIALTATDSLDVDAHGLGTISVHGSPVITGDASRVVDLDA